MIDPIDWLLVATIRSPKISGLTDWIDGTLAPVRVGYYERHFTDSMEVSKPFIHYWDGIHWLLSDSMMPHWRQVGDYPCWRGLTEDQAKLQGIA